MQFNARYGSDESKTVEYPSKKTRAYVTESALGLS